MARPIPRQVPAQVAKPQAPEPALVARVQAMRAEAEKLLAVQAEQYWRNWVYGDRIDIAATYQGHEALFEKRSVDLVARLASEVADPTGKRALEYFRLYLVGEAVGRAVAPFSDAAANIEVDATITVPGDGERPYRELNRLLASEVNYQLRGEISDAAVPVLVKLAVPLESRELLARDALARMGFPSYAAFGAALRQVDLSALARLAGLLLDDTEPLYRTAMDREARGVLGVGLSALRRADIPRLDRATAADAYFPAGKMVPALAATLAGLGIDLARQPNIRIDDAPLPGKNPRAVCFPVAVPGDIRLSVKPMGGAADWQALFHEAGHAEHYAHAQTPFFEFRELGDATTTEAYAFVLEDLVAEPEWLVEKTGMPAAEAAAFARGAATRKLYLLRRYAGKLLFEIAWHAGARDPRALYRKEMARAYLFPLSDADADRFLVDHDDFFYSADYFRAWFLAAQIEASLVRRFGPRWWDRKEAGEALIALWREGNRLSVDEVARAAGDSGLSTEPLLAQLRERLRGAVAPAPRAR